MRAILILALLLPFTAAAQTADEKATHEACDEQRKVETTPRGTKRFVPGYKPGWEKCEAFEATYQQKLRDAANAANAGAVAKKAARDSEAQEELNK